MDDVGGGDGGAGGVSEIGVAAEGTADGTDRGEVDAGGDEFVGDGGVGLVGAVGGEDADAEAGAGLGGGEADERGGGATGAGVDAGDDVEDFHDAEAVCATAAGVAERSDW